MQALKNIYLHGLGSDGCTPSLKRDWRFVLAWSLIVYAIVLVFRLSFAGRWDHPELWVGGERIMATHDAYFWLAKAKGVGDMAIYPLAQAVHFLQGLLDVSYGAIGFWTPAVMGALVGVACYLWGWLLGGRDAGIFAGLVGSLTPGFFYRSRLGYFDTDMFTLLSPMLIAWLLAYWAKDILKPRWGMKADPGSTQVKSPCALVGLAMAAGLCARGLSIWHNDILNLSVLYVLFTAVLVAVQARPGQRSVGFWGLSAFVLAAFPGAKFGHYNLWPFQTINLPSLGFSGEVAGALFGLLLAGCIALFVSKKDRPWTPVARNTWVALGFLAFVILWSQIGIGPLSRSLVKLLSYAAPATGQPAVSEAVGPIYPSIIQSIIEAKHVGLSAILTRGAFFDWFGWVAMAFMVVVVILRPLSAFLLPFVVLHLASMTLGIRFTMFGGAALIVFFGAGLWIASDLVLGEFPKRKLVLFATQILLGAGFLAYAHASYSKIPMSPVVDKAHAEALIEIGEISPPDATLWSWWDWGYASQYYAGRRTVVDGGRHAGREVFPVGFAMSSSSLEKSSRMILFSAQSPIKSKWEFGLSPFAKWGEIPRDEIDAKLQSELSRSEYPSVPPQYLVVTWKDMTILKWITYFGNWDLQTGRTSQAMTGTYEPGELGINVQRGAVMNRQGGGGLVKDITVLDWNSSQSQDYFMNSMSPQLLPQRQHLLVNRVSRASVLLDRIGYGSTMRRLLTEDPNNPEISKYFKLVVDKLPFARIYEVIQ